MPTLNFDLQSGPAPGSTHTYLVERRNKVWVTNAKPYMRKVGPFLYTRRRQRSGTFQDRYWPEAGYPYTGINWCLGNGDESGQEGSPLNPDERYSSFHEGTRLAIAIYKLQSEVAKADFNLGVAGAEAAKTVGLITHTATRLYQTARLVRQGRLFEAYRVLGLKAGKEPPKRLPTHKVREHAGNYWLEMQYGWKPLLMDMHGGMEYLAGLLNQPDADIFFAEARSGMKRTDVFTHHSGGSSWQTSYAVTQNVREVARVGISYRIQDGNILQAARLGLTNPALIAWEVVPFSFVVDWFLPIGNFLSQLSAYHGLDFAGGYQTQMTKIEQLFEPHYLPKGAVMRENSLRQLFRLERRELTAFPYARPVVKDPFSAEHGVTTLALLQNVLGGFKSKNLRI